MDKTVVYPSLQEVLDNRNVVKVSGWVSPKLKRRLDALTRRTGAPMSWLIRTLLETWIEQQQDS